MKNKVIYTEDKIYVYLDTNSNKEEFKKIKRKINFIKYNYYVNHVIMVYK